jgi:uncharacterized membrane protein YqhA
VVFRDLDALKSKLAGVIVLAMAVTFLEYVEANGDGLRLLETGLAIALVSTVLTWMAKK